MPFGSNRGSEHEVSEQRGFREWRKRKNKGKDVLTPRNKGKDVLTPGNKGKDVMTPGEGVGEFYIDI